MMTWYKLEGRIPVPCNDMLMAAAAFDDQDRTVALTETELFVISTVFLGIDHNFNEVGPPILFETMVFERGTFESGPASFEDVLGIFSRYSTWDEAEEGHRAALKMVTDRERSSEKLIKAIGKISTRSEKDG